MAADGLQARGNRRRQKIGHRYRAALDGRVMQLEDRTPASAQNIGVLQEKGRLGSLDVGNQIEIAHPGPREDLAQCERRHSSRSIAGTDITEAGAHRPGRNGEDSGTAAVGDRSVDEVDPQR